MTIKLELGLGAIRSFKRLSYTPWHALAEFVDNSTQSYFNNRELLDRAYKSEETRLTVDIEYDSSGHSSLTITDNAMGMSLSELEKAMVVGLTPKDSGGRSKYGFGLKTAASWFGDEWVVDTKKLGETRQFTASINVNKIAAGHPEIPVRERPSSKDEHFTIIRIRKLNRPMHNRTRGTIRSFLASMYRDDLRSGQLTLKWMGEELSWHPDHRFAKFPTGKPMRRDFSFKVDTKSVHGWAAVLESGSREKAGFSILHSGRVIKGYPEAWKPQEIYGQLQGSNNLVNQRLLGEIHLDDFEVSHTKDDILWLGDEEQDVELKLKSKIDDLIEGAKELRRESATGLPSRAALKRAANQVQVGLLSAGIERAIAQDTDVIFAAAQASQRSLLLKATQTAPDFSASINGLTVSGYLSSDSAPAEEFVAVDASKRDYLSVVINLRHPYLRGIRVDGFVDHLQHCTYSALAEWQAKHRGGTSDKEAVRFLQDSLMRAVTSMARGRPSGSKA